MRTNLKVTAASALAALLIGFNSHSCPAGEGRGDDYYRQRDDLIAREKSLLRQEDEVSYAVFEIKRTINELFKKLSAVESHQDSIRHQIISVRMKLMQ